MSGCERGSFALKGGGVDVGDFGEKLYFLWL